jgi:hypothetical protein
VTTETRDIPTYAAELGTAALQPETTGAPSDEPENHDIPTGGYRKCHETGLPAFNSHAVVKSVITTGRCKLLTLMTTWQNKTVSTFTLQLIYKQFKDEYTLFYTTLTVTEKRVYLVEI